MTPYVTVSFSGGKDSTAMLLHMMEIGEHIDEVINVDTGMEYPAMYEHIAKVRRIVEEHGIRYTELRAEHSFEWYMFEKEVPSKKWGTTYGYGWPGAYMRWCTKHLKTSVIEGYLKQVRAEHGKGNVIQCIGLATDETKRLERNNNQSPGHRHPLVEWGWTEADCIAYCKARGYDWGGLYDIFARVSCWCCPLARLDQLRKLRRHYPELWERLREMDARLHDQSVRHCERRFKSEYDIEELERRFAREDIAQREQTTLDIFGEASE